MPKERLEEWERGYAELYLLLEHKAKQLGVELDSRDLNYLICCLLSFSDPLSERELIVTMQRAYSTALSGESTSAEDLFRQAARHALGRAGLPNGMPYVEMARDCFRRIRELIRARTTEHTASEENRQEMDAASEECRRRVERIEMYAWVLRELDLGEIGRVMRSIPVGFSEDDVNRLEREWGEMKISNEEVKHLFRESVTEDDLLRQVSELMACAQAGDREGFRGTKRLVEEYARVLHHDVARTIRKYEKVLEVIVNGYKA